MKKFMKILTIIIFVIFALFIVLSMMGGFTWSTIGR